MHATLDYGGGSSKNNHEVIIIDPSTTPHASTSCPALLPFHKRQKQSPLWNSLQRQSKLARRGAATGCLDEARDNKPTAPDMRRRSSFESNNTVPPLSPPSMLYLLFNDRSSSASLDLRLGGNKPHATERFRGQN